MGIIIFLMFCIFYFRERERLSGERGREIERERERILAGSTLRVEQEGGSIPVTVPVT